MSKMNWLGGYSPLFNNRHWLLLWLGQAVSSLGDAIYRIALLLLVTELNSSPLALTAMVAVQTGTGILLGPVAGVLADRHTRRGLMLSAEIVRLLAVLLLVKARSVPFLICLALLHSAAKAMSAPARSALIPDLVGEEAYVSAASLNESTISLVSLIGPLLGGLVIGRLGFSAAFMLDAVFITTSISALCLLGWEGLRANSSTMSPATQQGGGAAPSAAHAASAAVTVGSPAPIAASAGSNPTALPEAACGGNPTPITASATSGNPAPAGRTSFWHQFCQGISAIVARPRIVFVLVLLLPVMIALGALNVLQVDYVRQTLRVSPEQYGLMESIIFFGSLLTTLLLGLRGRQLNKGRLLIASVMLMGATTATFLLHPGFLVVCAWAFLLGASDGLLTIPFYGIVVAETAGDIRGRVMGCFESLLRVGALVGLGLAGLAAARLGSSQVMGIAGVGVFLIGFFARWHPQYASLSRAAEGDGHVAAATTGTSAATD
ncbi:MAG: MFS transporter [Bacillota bacterium]